MAVSSSEMYRVSYFRYAKAYPLDTIQALRSAPSEVRHTAINRPYLSFPSLLQITFWVPILVAKTAVASFSHL